MSWIDWLEARLGFLGIPRLIQMIALLNGLVYVLHLLQPGYISLLTLQPALVMHGQLWRLVSYIFIPKIVFQNLSPTVQPLFLFIYLWFMVWIGDALEQAWAVPTHLVLCARHDRRNDRRVLSRERNQCWNRHDILSECLALLCFCDPVPRYADLCPLRHSTARKMGRPDQPRSYLVGAVVRTPRHQGRHRDLAAKLFPVFRANRFLTGTSAIQRPETKD